MNAREFFKGNVISPGSWNFFYRSFKNLWRDMIISFDAYKISLMIFNLLTASETHNTETFFLLFVRIFSSYMYIYINLFKYVLLIKKWVYISIFDFFLCFVVLIITLYCIFSHLCEVLTQCFIFSVHWSSAGK